MDQPVGTGYSYSKSNAYFQSQPELAKDFVGFLSNFLVIFPQYSKSEIYIGGESFAGTFIPYIAKEILNRNSNNSHGFIELRGLILGNAWVDPLRMYESYSNITFERSLIPNQFKKDIDDQTAKCKELYQRQEKIKYDTCEEILQKILEYSRQEKDKFCINMYDVRLRDTGPDQGCGMAWPKGLDATTAYLSRQDVIEALHASEASKKWVECDKNVFENLRGDSNLPSYKIY